MEELKRLFSESAEVIERIRSFRDQRIESLGSGRDPSRLNMAGGREILHVVPFSSISSEMALTTARLESVRDQLVPLLPNVGTRPRYTLEGFMVHDPSPERSWFTHIYRNGLIEAAASTVLEEHGGQTYIAGIDFERRLLEAVWNYLTALEALEVSPPIVVMVTLDGVEGAIYAYGQAEGNPTPIDRYTLVLPEIVLERYGNNTLYHPALRPVIDALYNAVNVESCPRYGADGLWREA